MRPGDFSPGNVASGSRANRPRAACFNEAGGFLPRKLDACCACLVEPLQASMRPGDFSPGNRLTALGDYHQLIPLQ